jgi:hypothetical protein
MEDTRDADPLEAYVGMTIILDTQGPLIYIGTLRRVTPVSLVLADADVHDSNDSRATKDLYLVETRDLGVRVNRSHVVVMRGQISSVSLLKDVVD